MSYRVLKPGDVIDAALAVSTMQRPVRLPQSEFGRAWSSAEVAAHAGSIDDPLDAKQIERAIGGVDMAETRRRSPPFPHRFL